ncbi:MAG: hypothetical protein WEA99_06265 [Brumimicrobium sp.]
MARFYQVQKKEKENDMKNLNYILSGAIFTILILFMSASLFAQTTELEKCGIDDHSTLNEFEAEYFNEVFLDRRGDFDFTDKKVAYFAGSSGFTKSDKSNYFNTVKSSNSEDIHEWQASGTQLLLLTEKEKEFSGGYDVILVSWSKLLMNQKQRKKLIRKLNNKL